MSHDEKTSSGQLVVHFIMLFDDSDDHVKDNLLTFDIMQNLASVVSCLYIHAIMPILHKAHIFCKTFLCIV